MRNNCLQSLKIPGGWEIVQNRFLDIEPEELNKDDDIWDEFTQDILQIQHKKRNVIIDLGWYPDIDPCGHYRVVAIKDTNWESPIERYESRSKEDIKNKIEFLLEKFSRNTI
ncbi:hypothetical protein [Clostridium saccharoperbutylacetonicum]